MNRSRNLEEPANAMPIRRRNFFGKLLALVAGSAFLSKITGLFPSSAHAMPRQSGNAFVGEIRMFAGNFAPRGWTFCHGQLLAISQHSALFSILGTIYGGNGRTNFALPDLRGRVPMQAGTGPGLTNRRLGAKGGAENVTLSVQQMPTHTHSASGGNNATAAVGNSQSPINNIHAAVAGQPYSTGTATGSMRAGSGGAAGGSQAHYNMQPFLTVNFIIALEGTFPSRS